MRLKSCMWQDHSFSFFRFEVIFHDPITTASYETHHWLIMVWGLDISAGGTRRLVTEIFIAHAIFLPSYLLPRLGMHCLLSPQITRPALPPAGMLLQSCIRDREQLAWHLIVLSHSSSPLSLFLMAFIPPEVFLFLRFLPEVSFILCNSVFWFRMVCYFSIKEPS